MTTLVLIAFFLLLLPPLVLRYPAHGIGVWVVLLFVHGILVHYLGERATHLPLYVGIEVILFLFVGRRKFSPSLQFSFLLAFLLLCMFLSLAINGGSESSLPKIFVYFKAMAVAFVISGFVKSTSDLRVIVKYIIAAEVVGSLFNIYQHYFGVYLVANEWDSSLSRAAGLRGDPNDTAMLLVLSIPLIYGMSVNARKFTAKLFYTLCGIVVFIGIVLTGSRAGFVVTAFIVIVMIFHNVRRVRPRLLDWPSPRNAIVASFFVFIAAITAPAYYWDRINTLFTGEEVGQAQSLYSRTRLAEESLRIWSKNPVFGVGISNFHEELYGTSKSYSSLRRSEDGSPKRAVAHNMYLEFLAEIGFFGFLTFLLICVYAVLSFYGLDAKAKTANGCRSLGYSYAIGLSAMLIFGLTLSQGYNSILWFIIGLGASAAKITGKKFTRKKYKNGQEGAMP